MEAESPPHPPRCPSIGTVPALDPYLRWDAARDVQALMDESLPVRSLEESAREAWRQSARCIGRLHWRSLEVVDARSLEDPDSVFDACVEHLRRATARGRIVPTQTVFGAWQDPQREIRIWNHQLLRYAGYRCSDGSVLGDPMNVTFTDRVRALGWEPPDPPGSFDLLPLLIQAAGKLVMREIPREVVLEVEIAHPEHPWLEKLGLRWHAVPAISDMIMANGHELFPCAPFNGWYMGTEIGARNFGDTQRYNLLPKVADLLGLARDRTCLWKDRALVLLNEAVLHSFERDGVRLVDHHQASREFLTFCERERETGHEVQADWSWIVPPISGCATGVFHRRYPLQPSLPNLLLQLPPWETTRGRKLFDEAVRCC